MDIPGMPGDSQDPPTTTSEQLDTHGNRGHASRGNDGVYVGGEVQSPREEIQQFVASNAAGMISSYSKPQLWRAAETLFTANGVVCPVRIEQVNGVVLLINREVYRNGYSD